MAIFLEVIDAAGNITRLPVEDGRIDVAAQPGTIYRVVDENGGPIGAGPRVLRVDDDIVITDLPAGEVVGLTDFFSACTPTQPCTLSLQEIGGSDGETVTPASEPVAALQEGGFLMNRLAVQSESLAPIESGGGLGWKPIAAGVGALAVLGAAGGGGGSGGGDSVPPVAPSLKSNSVNSPTPVLEGLAEPNSRVTVAINLGGTGAEVRYAATADAEGNWSVDLANDAPIAGALPEGGLPTDAASPVTLTAIDPAGNTSAGETVSVVVDTTPPVAVATITGIVDDVAPATATLTDDGASNDTQPTVTGTISAPLETGDFVAISRDGNVIGQATVTGTTFTFEDGPLPEGSVRYTAQVSDAAGNTTAASSPFLLTVDTTAPAAPVITDPDANSIITAAIANSGVTVSGTADATDASTVLIAFGTVNREANVAANGTWSTTFTSGQLPADGAQTIVVRAVDEAGNVSDGAASRAVTLDRTPPTPSFDTNGTAVTNDPFVVTITFSEAVTGFTASDVTVSGGTASNFSGSGSTYQLTVTPTANAEGNAVVSIAQGAGQDSAGNPSNAGSVSRPVDTAGPSLNITDSATGTATGPFNFIFTFDEPVSGFAANDITITGGTAGAFTQVNASTYQLAVTPGSGASGTVTATVANGAAVDAAGNPSTGDTASQPFVNDVTDPQLTISDTTPGATATGPVVFRFSFNEDVTGFTAADIDVSGVPASAVGPLTAVTSSRVFELTVTPAENTDGTITVEVDDGVAQDAAGNTSVTTNAGNSVSQAFDTDQLPTLAITTDAPTTVPARLPFEVTFTFSEPVTGFTAADVTVTNGALSGLSGSGEVYTATITPTDNTEGNIGISVRNNAAIDGQGNRTNATTGPTVAYDREDPDLTISDTTNANDTVTFTFTFSEPVIGFTAADVVVTSTVGTPTAGPLTTVGSSGAVYSMVVTPPDGETGDLTVSVAAGVAQDEAGNNNQAATEDEPFDTSNGGINLQSTASSVLTQGDLLVTDNELLSSSTSPSQSVGQPGQNEATNSASVSALGNSLLPDNAPSNLV